MDFKPTSEQEAIRSGAINGESMLIQAGAGAAKTSTLKLIAPELKGATILATAFNKRIAEDLAKALPETVVVKTLNGLGHSAWGKQRGSGRLEVDSGKLNRLTSAVMKESNVKDEDGELWSAVRNFARLCRNNQYVPKGAPPPQVAVRNVDELLEDFRLTEGWDEGALSMDEFVHLVDKVLIRSIMEGFGKVIDFDDQIYLSTVYFCPYPHYDVVLGDESQDLSPANHIQLLKTKPNQFIAVGDPRQAIYAFRGADSSSMENLRFKADKQLESPMVTYPLNTSFRCPKAVVARQQQHYPGFTAFETNPEGSVETLYKWGMETIPEGAAVICRNNAPLVSLAFNLVKNRRGFQFFGMDMAKNLKGLIKKVAGFSGKTMTRAMEAVPTDKILALLEGWYLEEELKLLTAGKAELCAGLKDRKQCCVIILKMGKTLGEAMSACDAMFSGTGSITLTSGHRSKGFEWRDVFHLDPFRIPSKFARESGKPAQMQQEMNLRYVIETRTKLNLTMIGLRDNQDAIGVEDE